MYAYIKGFNTENKLDKISILVYIDDLLLFVIDTPKSLHKVFEIFQNFAACSVWRSITLQLDKFIIKPDFDIPNNLAEYPYTSYTKKSET